MKSFSNTYIYIFSTIMVVSVSLLLAVAAISLKPIQDKNVEIEKKQNILQSVGKGLGADTAKSKNAYIDAEYARYITESFVVDMKGTKVEGDAFTLDLKVELEKPAEARHLPVFVFTGDSGDHKFIFPVRGKGLWGPIWGYVSLNDDNNTIFGTVFDHKGETPGLGAEINTDMFESQFIGKQIYEAGKFVSILVAKGGADDNNPHAVDAISGGTITSKGLEAMLYDCLMNYEGFFRLQKAPVVADTTTTSIVQP